MAATRAASPGGALLRASRLFSLPSQLPPAPGDIALAVTHTSSTATSYFPTLQSVTTTLSSRKHGDWGFKRPLPRTTTASTTTPAVRVKHVDSLEAVTDFASAADHTLSLEKWHEMNMPITIQSDVERNNYLSGRSVFEDNTDFTAFEPSRREELHDKRWKFEGPWLAGITEGEFQKYMKDRVRPKRLEFRLFLKKQLASDLNSEAAERAIDNGGGAPSALTADDITEEQLTEYLRTLRNSQSRVTLYTLVGRFLDLAPVQPSSDHFAQLGSLAPRTPTRTASPYAKEGPPITHPSAGLSYLRTNAFLDNHPVYGPQKSHAPVAARTVMPRGAGSPWPSLIGVGGFVADSPENSDYNAKRARGARGLEWFDPAVRGGAKTKVTPASAKVNSKGRVTLHVKEADAEATLVQKELQGRQSVFGQWSRPASQATGEDGFRQRLRRSTAGSTNMTGSSRSYGFDFSLGR